ncbi:transporter substrate-binding domain-containing protein [Blautia sp. MSJ-19]|uniref:transporter substrate-binding domain-containing protein n=1 Tax=Blautia sp. MSJ-19 TaxID=2841517 RepID=UPI00209F1360|nr:transporter substrate-binding domain-containing protein [Blautia sp. MSJ-19]
MATENKQSKSQVVRVGWYEDSYHITDKNGNRSGYGYEYEQAVSAYTGWDYEYVQGSWEELFQKLQNGEIDMMSALFYTDERAETMLFSDQPMGEEKYYLYADLTNSDISASDLSTLNGKSIGMMEGSVQTTQFSEWEKKYNVKTNHVFVDSIDQAKELLEKHEIQGVISTETSIWVDAGLSSVVTTGGSEIYYGISKNRPDIKEELDSAMRSMENDKPFYSDKLYEEYIATQSVAVLSKEEQEWLKQHGAIRIGYLKDDPGFSATDSKNGELVGVLNDYMDYAKNSLGQTLKFEIVGFDTQEEQIQALKNDKIDMIFHVNQNPYYAEKNNISLSNTVLSVPLAVVTSLEGFDESKENTIAVPKENAKFKWYVSYSYPDWKIIECDSLKDAEKMVQEDKADCLIARAGQATNFLGNTKLHCTFLTKSANSSFGVLKGNTVLLSILNKTLKSIQTSKLTGAVSMYEDTLKKVTITDFIKDNLLAVALSFGLIVFLILAVILRLLKKAQIAEEKAKEAQIQAENANAAKSNFLFNMSHDIRTPMNALLGYNQLMKNGLTDPKLLHYQRKMEQSGNLLLSIINNVLDMARIESGKMELDENYAVVGNIWEEIMGVFASTAKKKEVQLIYEQQVQHQHVMCDITKVKQIFVNLVSNAVKYTPSGGKVILRSQEIPCDTEGFIFIKTEIIDNGIGMSKEYLPKLFDAFTRERNTTTGKVTGTGLGMPIVKELVEMMGGNIEVESELGKGTKFTVTLRHRIADEKYYNQKSGIVENVRKEAFKGRHILLAEDNDLNAEIAITILEEMGLKIDRVEDGIECVSRIEQMPAGSYDLILMDIQMPNMDGYKATQTIRRLADKDKANIPIVAMTANAFKEDEEMALSVGMNGHIAKPIDVDKIGQVLGSILQ